MPEPTGDELLAFSAYDTEVQFDEQWDIIDKKETNSKPVETRAPVVHYRRGASDGRSTATQTDNTSILAAGTKSALWFEVNPILGGGPSNIVPDAQEYAITY